MEGTHLIILGMVIAVVLIIVALFSVAIHLTFK